MNKNEQPVQVQVEDLPCNDFRPIEQPMADDLPDFPAESLPEDMYRLVDEGAEDIQAPADMLACNTLGAASLCSQGRWSVNPKPNYVEPVNLYLACVAGPSERKSPAQNLVMAAPRRVAARMAEDMAEDTDRYRLELLRAEAEVERLKQACTGADAGKEAEEDLLQAQAELRSLKANPVRPLRLFADDVTPERLAELMNENRGRMALVSTEGGVFEMMRGLYSSRGSGTNIDIYTKSYSGDPISISRKGSSGRPGANIDIRKPCLTICTMIQPELLKSVMGDRMLAGKGLLARFLYSMPKSMAGRRAYYTDPIDPKTLENWEKLMERILACDDSRPHIITLSEGARGADQEFYNEIEEDLPAGLAGIAEWAGKFHGNVLRIAALLHICQNPEKADFFPISEGTMRNAVRIGHYFLAHARAAFGAADLYGTPEEQDARYIWRLLQGHDGETARALMRRSKFNRLEALRPGLQILHNHGYLFLSQEKTSSAGRKAKLIRLNPAAVKYTEGMLLPRI